MSGIHRCVASSTFTKPGFPPFGEASQLPSASAVASTANGACRMNSCTIESRQGATFRSTIPLGSPNLSCARFIAGPPRGPPGPRGEGSRAGPPAPSARALEDGAGAPTLPRMAETRPFRFGVVLRTARSGREWLEKAQRLERQGFDALYVADHLVGDRLAPLPAL